MPDNTRRFTGRAEDYDRYRERYPLRDSGRLRVWCGLSPSWLVADIGAGTGMVAEIFLANGNRVIAVEPNPDMLAHMRAAFAATPQLEILDATAEATTLPDASVDLIAVGRAFHWFDKERAIPEFRRILRPGGWVTIVAADRDRECKDPAFAAQIAAYENLLNAHSIDYALVRSGFGAYDKMQEHFHGEFQQTQLPGTRQFDWTTFRGHMMSLSISPQPGHPSHQAFMRGMRNLFDAYAVDGVFTMATTCWITAARFRA